ncbi:MAG: TauD/TfdA family dioxygenase [Rhodospirillales bacterium]
MSATAFVKDVHDSSVWTAQNFRRSREWAQPIGDAMLDDIRKGVTEAQARGTPFWKLTPELFPLPSMRETMAQALHDLEKGKGFAVLSGFPVDEFDRDQILLAYAGISAHLGVIVEQTHKGDRIIDVVDIGLPYSEKQRGYSSNKLLPFHTDGADMVGLLCLATASDGGLSVIVSAPAVYNAIRHERPDLLEVLAQGYFHHRRGEQAPGEGPISAARIPVFSFHNGLLHCCYNRNPIMWAEKEGVVLSPKEIEALDYLDAVTARPDMQLSMDLQVGDIQFLNNYICFHSRGEYHDGPNHRRHLLRIWVNWRESRRAGPTILNLYAPHQARQRH